MKVTLVCLSSFHTSVYYLVVLLLFAVLDVEAFERLLGPCMELMKRNIDDYESQLEKIFGSKHNITDVRWTHPSTRCQLFTELVLSYELSWLPTPLYNRFVTLNLILPTTNNCYFRGNVFVFGQHFPYNFCPHGAKYWEK